MTLTRQPRSCLDDESLTDAQKTVVWWLVGLLGAAGIVGLIVLVSG